MMPFLPRPRLASLHIVHALLDVQGEDAVRRSNSMERYVAPSIRCRCHGLVRIRSLAIARYGGKLDVEDERMVGGVLSRA